MARAAPHRLFAAALAIAMAGAAPAGATVLRDLDFQGGGLLAGDGTPRQWDNYVPSLTGTSGITLGSPGTLPFPFLQAARFEPPEPAGRPRSMAKLAKHSLPDPGVELSGPLDAAEGLERHYRWYTYFPRTFDLPDRPIDAPAVFMAWHNDSSRSGCNTNVQMHVKRRGKGPYGLRLLMRVQGGRHSPTPPWLFQAEGGSSASCFTETYKEVDLGPLPRGRWIGWTMHARWSSDPTMGMIEIAHGRRTMQIPGANLYVTPGGQPESGYVEQGIYSPVDTSEAARHRAVWHAGMIIADTAADVRPPGDCRRLQAPARGLRLAGERITFSVDARAARDRPAFAHVQGPVDAARRIVLVAGDVHTNFRGRRARLPASVLNSAGLHALRVRVLPAAGSPRSVALAVRTGPCGR